LLQERSSDVGQCVGGETVVGKNVFTYSGGTIGRARNSSLELTSLMAIMAR